MHRLRDRAAIFARPFTFLLGTATAIAATLAPSFTETAIANGETRTLYLFHAHTKEQIAATYLVNGRYDQAVLAQLDWFLRDWRRDEATTMDPRLYDVVWEAYRQAGATEPVHVVSAYRSPDTNAMLRRRSRAVAKHSQHMLGKAMDTTMPGMSMSQIREIAMRMQRGGVGYYPTAGTPFVHLDVGGVRSWPRMSYEQLARLFPDGKTVHLPSNNQPLARYEEAKAEIEGRGNGAYVPAMERRGGGLLAFLFGGGEDDEDAGSAAPASAPRKQWASLAPRPSARGAEAEEEEAAAATAAAAELPGRRRLAEAARDLPRGETAMRALPAPETGASDAGDAPPIVAPPPPRRPTFLAYADAPPPPTRPADLSIAPPAAARRAGGAIASFVDVAGATLRGGVSDMSARGDISARGAGFAAAPKPEPLLAYAASAFTASVPGKAPPAPPEAPKILASARPTAARPTAAPRIELAPARLDRSNFQALTTAVSASRLPAGSMLGSTLAAPRSAARVDAGLFVAQSGQAQVFAARTDMLPAGRFAPR